MHSVVKDSLPLDSQALVVDTEPTPDTYNLFTITNGAKPSMVKVHVTTNLLLDRILSKYPMVFNNELGLFKEIKAKMFVDVDATPKFFKPRSVSYYLKKKVEQELACLQDDGMISPVGF